MLGQFTNWLRGTPAPLDPAEVPILDARLAAMEAEERLAWAWERFGARAAIGTSFQPAGIVLLHLAKRHGLGLPAFTLDTGLLFRETIELKSVLQDHFGIIVESVLPDLNLTEQARRHGDRLWERDPDACCGLRKVAPLGRKLRDLDVWITGLRRDGSVVRASTPILEAVSREDGSTVWKLNPLADWTRERVWAHLREHHIPYNPLHDMGYRSIGCAVCTRPGCTSSDERAGRWPGFDKNECGLHIRLPRHSP